MSEPSDVGTPAARSLSEYLQQITEALAATTDQTDVFKIVLQPALAALNAITGAVLLVDATGKHLVIAATQGYEAHGQTIWQDGPLDGNVPAGDALERHQALFFEHLDALVEAYPMLEERTGAVAPVATAILPMFLGQQPLGTLILDFKEPHTFSTDERRFLQTLAAQTAVALSRAQLLGRLQTSETLFRRLVQISPLAMGAGSLDGQLSLVNDAYLQLIGQTRTAFEAGHIDWQAITPQEFQDAEREAFEIAWDTGTSPRYRKELITPNGERIPVEIALVRQDEQQMVGYAQDLRPLRALERLVDERTAILLNEQAASQAFITFSQQTAQATDLSVLAGQAIAVLRAVLQDVSVAYYELQDGRWRAQCWSEDISPAFLQAIQAGFTTDTPRFATAVASGQLLFVDGWDPAREQLPTDQRYSSIASYPFFLHGQPHSLLSVGRREHQVWEAREQAVVRAVGQALGLALGRTEVARQLQCQKEEVESRNRALEAFSSLTGVLDVRLDRATLIRRTQELVLSLLPPGYAAYFEPENGLWRLKVQTGNAGLPALQAALDAGFPVGATPTLDRAMHTSEPYFIDVYVKDTDIDPEVAGHLNAAACLPLFVRGHFIGIFNLPLFETRVWDATDRAILISAVQSLTLALEGAQSLDELAQRSAELEESNQSLLAANEELEAFTYSASHDLRTPVRHVMGFSELTQKAVAKANYDKADAYLKTIQQAAGRMTSLIDGMLVLSRSGRQELKAQVVDLNGLVMQARRDVGREFPEQPVRWHIDDLPRVQGDPLLLQQVLTNLLSNAVKYASKRELSEVWIWAEERPTEWMVRIRDNGVGFDPNYAQRLFGIFQRLHHERDFQGTGVGLATVRRIVLKHGGRVFAESLGEGGATFSFTLPKRS
ncbi:GAF domain-containing protein [Deinococcus ruber]|uniref:histidine kinase n=1 Tax=Deinococcus ruber TaxID=1848197 RepID=A0A918FH44_9DEIO|nr:GAF domain-containing protein [Deinococcus ruber]GGR37414.1 hypothetical protein GCM10008957_53540 [Deinococcus ruber]